MKLKYLMIPLIILKSFFMAITQVAWGIVSIVALKVALIYALEKDALPVSVDELFLKIVQIIVDYMVWFALIFFVIYLYFDLNEFAKTVKGEENANTKR